MYKEKSIVNSKKIRKIAPDWDAAIQDAKQRIKELKASIKVFEQNRDAGSKWPGFDATQTKAAVAAVIA